MTDAYRGPAHQKCEITVTQKQSIFFQLVFHNFSNYDCHLLFKKLVVKKTVKEIDRIPKTTEECVSVTNGCIQFFARYQFLSTSLDSFVKTVVDNINKKPKIKKKLLGMIRFQINLMKLKH